MLVNFTFVGLLAPVFTIFNQDFSVNLDRIPKYAQYLKESRYDGVLVAATSGEGTSLSVRERKNLTEAWARAVKETKQHLMVQVGGAPIPDVLELARHAEKIGVDSILTLPELYFKPKTVQELINYMKFISAAAPNTPLLYYHNILATGINIDMAEFLRQSKDQLPNLVGIKYTSNDLVGAYAALTEASSQGKTVFMGGDYLLEPAFATGFKSAIATSMSPFPSYAVKMLEAIQNSEIKTAIELQQNLTRIMDISKRYGSKVATMKLAMNLFTPVNVGLARPPLQNPSPVNIVEMRTALQPFL
ncbi:N-acetylneuraminate lyase-like [Anthonomus grandis grandis]|uniref:N-acetylneuraminate lyase-like n=1 Tax=Anthonomus grandis grandis TaxID=2921223 RepID=UPI002165073A|nr:N-acetylneuraminate lyase-like [Anthonomus grandis grandis]